MFFGKAVAPLPLATINFLSHRRMLLLIVLIFCFVDENHSFNNRVDPFLLGRRGRVCTWGHRMTKSDVEEYKNSVTKVLSKFMQKNSMATDDPLSDIDFNAPKIPSSTSLETLAAALDYELIEKEWFVTGQVNPIYFADTFEFQDPDVQLKGIEAYARGVLRLFDQETSRAQIISTVVNATTSTPESPIITCTWRLSGNVNIAFGLPIKPYIVYTDFTIDPKTSLIVFQEDRFDIPAWDILLSALIPGLIGKVTSQPAPSVDKRMVAMPNLQSIMNMQQGIPTLQSLFSLFGSTRER